MSKTVGYSQKHERSRPLVLEAISGQNIPRLDYGEEFVGQDAKGEG